MFRRQATSRQTRRPNIDSRGIAGQWQSLFLSRPRKGHGRRWPQRHALELALLGLVAMLALSYFLPDVGAKSYWLHLAQQWSGGLCVDHRGCAVGIGAERRLFRARVSPLVVLGMHSLLSWLGLGMAALHGIILIGDGYINIDLPRVLTPFLSEYKPIPVGLGTISFYLMLLLTLSFYARSHLGQRTFRLLHYGSSAVS